MTIFFPAAIEAASVLKIAAILVQHSLKKLADNCGSQRHSRDKDSLILSTTFQAASQGKSDGIWDLFCSGTITTWWFCCAKLYHTD